METAETYVGENMEVAKQQAVDMKPAPPPSPVTYLACVLLIGFSRAVNISVPAEPVQAVVGDSVLLPVSYSISQPPTTLQVIWNHENSIVLFSEMTMCGSEDPPTLRISDEYHIVVGRYQHRVVFFPENASLLLRDVRWDDSGRYTVTFQELNQSRSMMLVIHDPETTSGDPDPTQYVCNYEEERKDGQYLIPPLAVRAMCAAIFILLVIGLHCTWWRQARKYRTVIL
ncbi:HEPACAM family member 2-like [Leptodactylus fuscus]